MSTAGRRENDCGNVRIVLRIVAIDLLQQRWHYEVRTQMERQAERRPMQWALLQPRERILDRMADMLLCADDILEEMNATHFHSHGENVRTVIQRVFDDVNGLMKSMAD